MKKKNRPLFLNNKGNALIIVLITIVILSTLILGYLSLTFYQYKNNARKINYISLKWAAAGALNKFSNDILTYKTFISDTLIEDKINDCIYTLKLNKNDNNNFYINILAEKQNIKYQLSLALKIKFLSDYLFYVKEDFYICPRFADYQLYGSLFIENNLYIATQPKGKILFFYNKTFNLPPLNICGNIDYGDYAGLKSTIKIGLGDIEKNIEDMVIIDKENIATNIQEKFLKKTKSDFEIPSLKTIYMQYKNKAAYYIQSVKNLPVKKIINKYLLEKEVVGMGNNNALSFPLADKKGTDNIYFTKMDSFEKYVKVNPFFEMDTKNINKHFIIKENKLILDSDSKLYKLDMPKEEFSKLNTFPFLSDNIIYCPGNRKIKNVYLKEKILYEGNEYEIDYNQFNIYFYSPDFTEILGTGNGLKKEFSLDTKPIAIFKNRDRIYDYKIKDNKIIFNYAPAYGEKIYYYKYQPEIYITKAVPGYGVAVCIDKQIECALVDLDKINYPDNSVIVSDIPLYIYGNYNKNIAFIVNDDVYVNNIEADHSISIFGRIIWLDFNNKEEINLNNVYFFSEADKLYSLNFNEKNIKNIKGAMTFLCHYKSLTRTDKPIEPYVFYNDGNFFNGYFEYNDNFLKNPPLCAPFKIEKGDEQL